MGRGALVDHGDDTGGREENGTGDHEDPVEAAFRLLAQEVDDDESAEDEHVGGNGVRPQARLGDREHPCVTPLGDPPQQDVREVQQHGDELGQETDVLKVALARLHEQLDKLHIDRRLFLHGNNNKQPEESQLIILNK